MAIGKPKNKSRDERCKACIQAEVDIELLEEKLSDAVLASHVLMDWIQMRHKLESLPPWRARWKWLDDDVV